MRPQRRIHAVIFDMDGVLTDSEPLINRAAITMFGEKGLKVVPEDFLPFVGTGEDRYIGGVAEKYKFLLDIPIAGMRCVAVAQTFPAALLSEADLVRQRSSEVSLEDLLGGE